MAPTHQPSASPLLVLLATLLSANVACRHGATQREGDRESAVHTELQTATNARFEQGAAHAAGLAGDTPRVVTFQGTCDASGAVELDDRTLVVADDENNVLRV